MQLTEALLTVLLAGIAESIGQSVVLFVNRVSPARFVLSLLVNGVLVALGYAALVLCTWLTFLVPGSRPVEIHSLAIAVAVSYTPLLLAFLAALPYAGNAVLWGLRAAQLVAMATGVAAAVHLTFWASALHVAIGWTVLMLSRRAFAKQLTRAISFVASAVAGTPLVEEKVAVSRVLRDLIRASDHVLAGAPGGNHKHRYGVPIFGGIIVTFASIAAILVALTPLHAAIARVYVGGVVFRAGLDILWIALAAVLIAAFLAPFETLGWWAGWTGNDVDPAHHAATSPAGATASEPRRYIVYLDGISQSSAQYTPDVETFLDALQAELPAGVRLVRGIMAYSVLNRPLDDDPMYAEFWKAVERLRSGAKTAILGMFINIRNVMIVAVSADSRYGPLYNLGMAQVVYNDLVRVGYRPHSGVPITMIGYSGGGQMCAETAPLLKRALGAPIDVISLGGVMTGTCPFLNIDRLHHMHGSRDVIEPLGPLMFSSRWKIVPRSNWNRALRKGKITIVPLGPVGHQVPGGMLDPAYALPDGRSALRQTLDRIHDVISTP